MLSTTALMMNTYLIGYLRPLRWASSSASHPLSVTLWWPLGILTWSRRMWVTSFCWPTRPYTMLGKIRYGCEAWVMQHSTTLLSLWGNLTSVDTTEQKHPICWRLFRISWIMQLRACTCTRTHACTLAHACMHAYTHKHCTTPLHYTTNKHMHSHTHMHTHCTTLHYTNTHTHTHKKKSLSLCVSWGHLFGLFVSIVEPGENCSSYYVSYLHLFCLILFLFLIAVVIIFFSLFDLFFVVVVFFHSFQKNIPESNPTGSTCECPWNLFRDKSLAAAYPDGKRIDYVMYSAQPGKTFSCFAPGLRGEKYLTFALCSDWEFGINMVKHYHQKSQKKRVWK